MPLIMNNMKKISVIFLISFLLSSFPGTAKSQDRVDSLPAYLMLAAKNNPEVLQKFAGYQAALEKIPQATSLPDPELSLEAFLSPMEIISGKQVANVSLMQMFPWFGTLKAADDEMSLMAKSNYEIFRVSKLQVFFEVSKTYYQLYLVNKEIEISEKSLDILKTIGKLTLARFKGGSVTASESSGTGASMSSSRQMNSDYTGSGLTDLYRIQIETGEAENNIASLQSRLKTLTATFNNQINRPSLTDISIPDTIIAENLPLTPEAILDTIRLNNPMIRMYDYEKQSLEARKRMVTKMGYPMIGAGINYSVVNTSTMSSSDMNGKDMIMPMLKVTLPVYRKKYRAMRAETDFRESSSGYGRDATLNTLETEYYNTLQDYQDATRRLYLYSNQLQLSEKSLLILLKSYGVAGADLTSVLQLRQQCLDYKLKRIEAVSDINISTAAFRQLMATEDIL
jgi:outer membrane protein TolC